MLGLLPLLDLPVHPDPRLRYSIASMVENVGIKLLHKLVPLNLAVCEENLRLLHRTFAKHNIPFWLEHGTSLGVLREGRLIPYDDDVDIGLWATYREAFLSRVLPELRTLGFRLAETKGNTFLVLLRKNEKVDVSTVPTDQPGAQCMAPGSDKGMVPCSEFDHWLRQCRPVTFLGRTFWVPPEDYMVYGYGKNWRTHDWRRDCRVKRGKTVCDR